MITELSISHLGTIDDISLSLQPGFTVITGETGAGKTMLITSMKSLTGAKIPSQLLSDDGQKTTISAAIYPHMSENTRNIDSLVKLIEDNDGTLDDDGTALVVRTFTKQGRSKTLIGGQPVPLQLLAHTLSSYITIHGQNDQLRLLQRDFHGELLDSFGGEQLAQCKLRYSDIFQQYRTAKAAVADFEANQQMRAEEVISLQAIVADIDSVSPRIGEEEQLHELIEQHMIAAADKDIIAEVIAILDDEVSLANLMGKASATCLRSSDEQIIRCAELLHDAQENISHVLSTCVRKISEFSDSDSELEKLLLRQKDIKNLSKKYYRTIPELLIFYQNSSDRLRELHSDDSDIEQLKAHVEHCYAQLVTEAEQLSLLRKKAAETLAREVTEHLCELAMPTTSFTIHIEPQEFAATGKDRVEFYLTRGNHKLPINTVASGGELSRITLAIELALANGSSPMTMIFDEVDAGVGGQAALTIGQKLAKLAQLHQVLVVTHLPQVAAYANQHIRVVKTDTGFSTAVELSQHDRVTELARMLAGVETSDAAREHARELLALSALPKN